jgi:uncharacterized Zn finger protein (UPF0148 family)
VGVAKDKAAELAPSRDAGGVSVDAKYDGKYTCPTCEEAADTGKAEKETEATAPATMHGSHFDIVYDIRSVV